MLDTIKGTVKYPTSLIINGSNNLALELADSLLEQGGYVIIVDAKTDQNAKLIERLGHESLLSFIDYDEIPHIEDKLRRLDYVFYLTHEADNDLSHEISTQQFLNYSNYLDSILDLTVKFEAKFLLTTSIKAHQLSLQTKEFEVNFGVAANKKHSVYTEMEIQRYAESLTVEYIEKVEVDARILRLGEIIGEGMDYAADTPFSRLISAAVKGQSLPVDNDGLHAEWYVHILDAVYGIVKAQFSRNTAGNIYTLSYSENYSDLSIAYKIHDFEPEAGEIEFTTAGDGKSDLPMLNVYKPASNLNEIGWKPRVDIDEAIKQSLSGTKLYLATQVASGIAVDSATGDADSASKLKSFLRLAKGAQEVPAITPEFAKDQRNKLKTINISSANNKNKKKRKRDRNSVGGINNLLWKIYLGMRRRFKVVGDMTPGQLAFWVVFWFVSLMLYFSVVSPGVVLVRNYYNVQSLQAELLSGIKNSSFDQVAEHLSSARGMMGESSKIVNNWSGLANLLGLASQQQLLTETLDSYRLYFDGMHDIAESIEPLYQYLAVYEDKTFYRPNSDSYLAVESLAMITLIF